MTTTPKITKPKMATTKTKAPRKATDKRVVGTSQNPTKVNTPSAVGYKMPPTVKVAPGKPGRPKKAK